MLQSPHTIDVYDFGVADDGAFYMVMELLEGRDLHRLVVEEGPLSPERAVFLLAQVCHSLEEAHARGLVHRDIKPANLFVCRRGLDVDFVKVLDFGLVKLQDGAERTQLTMDDAISGTPAYIAPEMATGGAVDHRADIYAIGCVAFYLLTGSVVFAGETPMAMVFAHAQREAPSPLSLRPDLPAGLDALILACLRKDPAARPQSCGALRAELLALT